MTNDITLKDLRQDFADARDNNDLDLAVLEVNEFINQFFNSYPTTVFNNQEIKQNQTTKSIFKIALYTLFRSAINNTNTELFNDCAPYQEVNYPNLADFTSNIPFLSRTKNPNSQIDQLLWPKKANYRSRLPLLELMNFAINQVKEQDLDPFLPALKQSLDYFTGLDLTKQRQAANSASWFLRYYPLLADKKELASQRQINVLACVNDIINLPLKYVE